MSEKTEGIHSSEKHPDVPVHTFDIIVNAKKHTVTGKEITFEQLVKLAFETSPFGENTVFTVTYRRGHGEKPEGSMAPGSSVKLKEGMIFNVTVTDKS